MPIAPAAASANLQNNTVSFLKKYPVRIFGATTASGIAQYGIGNRGNSQRPGGVLGTHNWHDTESFNIRSTRAFVDPGAYLFNAHSIHMDVGMAAMGLYRLPSVGGPNIMVTGQLSGCAFIVNPVAGGNSLDVAHIQPNVHNAVTLRNALAAANPNGFVYGVRNQRGYYDNNDRVVSIVGVRAGGQWRIYAQKQAGAANNYRIVSVWEIYPQHRKV